MAVSGFGNGIILTYWRTMLDPVTGLTVEILCILWTVLSQFRQTIIMPLPLLRTRGHFSLGEHGVMNGMKVMLRQNTGSPRLYHK